MAIHPYFIIIPTGLVLGIATGFLMHRSDFCVAGMFRDVFIFRSFHKLVPLLVLLTLSMVLFESARVVGLLPIFPFPMLGSPSLANLIGGFLFGIGMSLAGGCVVGVLYKMGAGSIIGLTAFSGIILGSALYAEIHPLWSGFIRETTLFKGRITLPELLELQPWIVALITVIPCLLILYRLHKKGIFRESQGPEGYIAPYKTALLLAVVGLISYLFVGMPLGITTTYAKIAGFIEQNLIPEHFDNLAFFKVVSLRYEHPLTGVVLSGGPMPAFDAITAIQAPIIIGIITGSFLSALSLKEFRVYYKQPLRQYVSALIGGCIVGLASRLTPACNVWHIFGGLPIFALQSILFVAGLLPGVWVGSRLLLRFVFR